MYQQFSTFEGVEAVRDSERALLCRVNGLEVWVPHDWMALDDRVISKAGDRGRLVLPAGLAAELGLDGSPPQRAAGN